MNPVVDEVLHLAEILAVLRQAAKPLLTSGRLVENVWRHFWLHEQQQRVVCRITLVKPAEFVKAPPDRGARRGRIDAPEQGWALPVNGVRKFRSVPDLTSAEACTTTERVMSGSALVEAGRPPCGSTAADDGYRVKQLAIYEMTSIWK